MRMLYKFAICCLFIFSLPANAAFECYSGRPACLQSNDKVVSSDAVCFSSWTCGWGGFVCKSDHKKLASAYDDLASEYDSCRNNYNNLSDQYDELISEYNNLIQRYNELLNQ